jgi:hypothetical protein
VEAPPAILMRVSFLDVDRSFLPRSGASGLLLPFSFSFEASVFSFFLTGFLVVDLVFFLLSYSLESIILFFSQIK